MTDATAAGVKIVGVNKWYGAFQVLRNAQLLVRPGTRTVVCGPSGSGKSTLIRCVNGLERFQEGMIEVNGHRITDRFELPYVARREIGMVFQNFNLFPHLTVLANCTLPLRRVLGKTRNEAEQTALSFLEQVKIPEQAKKYPGQLSGGQQQRVAIARALCLSPKLMLFDEPTSALDPEMVKEVLDTMVSLAAQGMTMVCVTHEMGFARQVADEIVFMDGGQVVETAPPAEFFAAPRNTRTKQFLQQLLH